MSNLYGVSFYLTFSGGTWGSTPQDTSVIVWADPGGSPEIQYVLFQVLVRIDCSGKNLNIYRYNVFVLQSFFGCSLPRLSWS